MSVTLHDPIEAIIGQRPSLIQPLHGGMIGEVYRIDFTGRESLAAKVASPPFAQLDVECFMLRYLREHTHLPLPEVLHCEPTLLLMSLLPGDSQLTPAVQAHAADLVASLHAITADRCGLERDTLIGSLHQPNPWTESWVEFFREERLLHMARAALVDGRLSPAMLARIERLAARLDAWLEEPERPSLLHGDLWTTNIMAEHGRVTGFIDPAIYYGHPEIELAFSTLFGTFGEPFFERYTAQRPIAPGFMEVRRHLYNLYPLLVHARIFGGSYVNAVDQTLIRFGL